MAKCYPRIKDYCREKHGLEFQVVDMRWGVRDEATDDHMTTELCMREIKNCQRLSMGPNFIVFLGQKYGYRPIPTYIVSSELALICEELTSMGVDRALLDLWYKKDSNAVPPISVLQPISSILINFNNKVSGWKDFNEKSEMKSCNLKYKSAKRFQLSLETSILI